MGVFDFLTGADEQAKEIKKATNRAIEFQQQGQEKAAGILSPGANYAPIQSKLWDLLGLNGGQAQQGAYGQYAEGPDVQFQREQGEQAAMRGASAGGHLASGRTMTDLSKFGTGLARQGFGDWYSRLRDLYGTSLGTAGQLAGGWQSNGSNLAQLAMNGGSQYAAAKGAQAGVGGDLLSQGLTLAAYLAGSALGGSGSPPAAAKYGSAPGSSASSYMPGALY